MQNKYAVVVIVTLLSSSCTYEHGVSSATATSVNGMDEENDAMKKCREIGIVLDSVLSVQSIAADCISNRLGDSEISRSVDKIIDQLSSSENLVRFAIHVNRIAYPGDASCDSYDRVFHYAFWESVERLTVSGEADAISLIARLICAQDGTALRLREAINSISIAKEIGKDALPEAAAKRPPDDPPP